MISLENLELQYGQVNGIDVYLKECEENKGIYFLGGKLPIKKTDFIKKDVIENVKKMLLNENVIDNNFKEFRKLYYEIYSVL